MKPTPWLLAGTLLLAVGAAALAEITPEDVMAYWPINGSLGDPLQGNHGVLRGTSLRPEFVDSPLGRGIRLDGKDQWIEIAGEMWDNPPALSVSLWLRHEGKAGTLLFRGDESWYLNVLADGTVENDQISAAKALKPGQWQHLVFTNTVVHRGGDSEIYLDGKKIETGGTAFQLAWQGVTFDEAFKGQLTLGGAPGHRLGVFAGALDELAYFRKVLSAEEVAQLWNGGKGRALGSILPDADGGGLPDAWEKQHAIGQLGDKDGDGLSDVEEWRLGTNPTKEDTDSDGLRDAVETSTSPVWKDTDWDGLPDGEEAPRKLDPLVADSDQDGYSDGDEIKAGSDPTNRQSIPDLSLGLKAYWPFEGDFEDKVGGYHGLPSPSKPTFTDGLVTGKSLAFTGAEFVDVSRGEDFVFQGKSFSVALWFQTKTLSEEELERFSYRDLMVTSGVANTVFPPDSEVWRLTMHYETNPAWRASVTALLFNASPIQRDRYVHAIAFTDKPRHVVAVYDESGPASVPASVYLDGEKRRYFRSGAVSSPGNNRRSLRIGNKFGGVTDFGWLGRIDDIALWSRALTESEAKVLYAAKRPLSGLVSLDADGDGLPTAWEKLHGLDPSANDANADKDGDGLSNQAEFRLGTNPAKADSDDDGAPDATETGTGKWLSAADRGSNPLVADTDGDGLWDGREIPDAEPIGQIARANPNLLDTDGDGVDDGTEARSGTNPSDAASVPGLALGLLAHWPLDADTKDRLGVRHAKAKLAVKHEVGRFGQGVYFDGKEQYLEVPDPNATFNVSKEGLTVSVWVRQEEQELGDPDGNPWPGIVVKGDGSFHGWSLLGSLDHDGPGSFYEFSELHGLAFAPRLEQAGYGRFPLDGTFRHLAGVADSKTKTLLTYVDGKPMGKPAQLNAVDSYFSLLIGRRGETDINIIYPGSLLHFKGVIDDVAIWSRALSENELRQIVQSGKSLAELTPSAKPLIIDPTDTDHDGSSDAAERIAGTNPNDPKDYLRILSAIRNASGTFLAWNSVPGKRYQPLVSLSFSGSWYPLGPPIMAQGRTASYQDQRQIQVIHPSDDFPEGGIFNGKAYFRVRALE